jgi:hypothetical protein
VMLLLVSLSQPTASYVTGIMKIPPARKSFPRHLRRAKSITFIHRPLQFHLIRPSGDVTGDKDLFWGTTGVTRTTVFQPLFVLLLSQFVLFLGVGAVIPSIPLYGKEIGLSGAANGIVISAPAVSLLLLAKAAGRYADQARKPAMMIGMAIIVVSDIGTACAQGD